MAGADYLFTEEQVYTDFEIINVRELSKEFGKSIRIMETDLHYGGISTKISAQTIQDLKLFLWLLNKIFESKKELNKVLANQSGKFVCENDEVINNKIEDFKW